MPIRTTVTVQADEARFKKTYAAFEKYRAALKETHGVYVLQAPHIRAVSAVGGDLAKFVNGLDHAARSQTTFATAADKAHHAFRGLAGGVARTLEGFARVALSPLQMLFPAGLSVGFLDLALALSALALRARRYMALIEPLLAFLIDAVRPWALAFPMALSLRTSLNFSRFGVGEGTLGAVASGVYDVTSPEYLGLLSSGATGHGDTSEAAIDLIRNIPKIFAGYSDGMVGPVARSHSLDRICSIFRRSYGCKNHPEEIEAQIARYRLDRKTLDISKDAQQKWASFDAALSRAGQKIKSALGRNLVSLAPGLKQVF